jgi:hypothetical protein
MVTLKARPIARWWWRWTSAEHERLVIRLLDVVDEFTREALEMLVERSIDAERTVEVLERSVADRGAPEAPALRQRPGDDRPRAL